MHGSTILFNHVTQTLHCCNKQDKTKNLEDKKKFLQQTGIFQILGYLHTQNIYI